MSGITHRFEASGKDWDIEVISYDNKPPEVRVTYKDTDYLIRNPSDPRWHKTWGKRNNELNGVVVAFIDDFGPFCRIKHVNQDYYRQQMNSIED